AATHLLELLVGFLEYAFGIRFAEARAGLRRRQLALCVRSGILIARAAAILPVGRAVRLGVSLLHLRDTTMAGRWVRAVLQGNARGEILVVVRADFRERGSTRVAEVRVLNDVMGLILDPGLLFDVLAALLLLGVAHYRCAIDRFIAALGCRGHFIGMHPRRRIARHRGMVVGGQVHVADDVLALELDVHRPAGEVDLALVLRGDDALLGRAAGLIAVTGLVIALVLEHHLLAADLYRAAAVGGVLGHPGVGVGDGHARWRRWRLRRGETHIREGGDGLAAGRLAGDFAVVGVDLVGHQPASRWFRWLAARCRSAASCAGLPSQVSKPSRSPPRSSSGGTWSRCRTRFSSQSSSSPRYSTTQAASSRKRSPPGSRRRY